jgi:CDP-paratose 2-epimerase
MFRRVLITGGAGFIGSHIALAWKARFPDAQIIAFDNLRRRGSELNLPLLRGAGITFVHGDVRTTDDLAALPSWPDMIVECSAEPSAQAGYGGSPGYMIDTNLRGCVNCLELARRTGAAFVFLSSSRVYPYDRINGLAFEEDATRFRFAAEDYRGIAEDFPLEGARSLYGASKLAAELLVQEYGAAYGTPYVINRCGLVSGPRQMGKSDQGVVALWLAAHYFQRPIRYIGFGGEGKQVRDILHVADLTGLILMQADHIGDYSGGVFNVGGGFENSLSLAECTETCREITGHRIEIAPEALNRPADLRIYITDNRRVSAVGGWRPIRTPKQTLQDIHEWIRAEEGVLRSIFE